MRVTLVALLGRVQSEWRGSPPKKAHAGPSAALDSFLAAALSNIEPKEAQDVATVSLLFS